MCLNGCSCMCVYMRWELHTTTQHTIARGEERRDKYSLQKTNLQGQPPRVQRNRAVLTIITFPGCMTWGGYGPPLLTLTTEGGYGPPPPHSPSLKREAMDPPPPPTHPHYRGRLWTPPPPQLTLTTVLTCPLPHLHPPPPHPPLLSLPRMTHQSSHCPPS